MKLTVFNGSPRGEKSNTKIFLEQFLQGFAQTPDNSFEIYYLDNIGQHSGYADILRQSEAILLAFPLYTDAMPGIVKAFIEELHPSKGKMTVSRTDPKRIFFLVQSGFPEAVQLEAVEKYLMKLAQRLNCQCVGVIIKGGGEGIQEMPPSMTRKTFDRFHVLGEIFGRTGILEGRILKKIRGMHHFSPLIFPVIYLMKLFGQLDLFWNSKLKANHAFKSRFDRPYLKDAELKS